MSFDNTAIKLVSAREIPVEDTERHLFPEKRISKRIYFKSHVRFGLQQCNLKATSFNLSETGIGVLSNKVFPIGTRLLIRIHISDYTIISEGLVARLHEDRIAAKTRMGIKFVSRTDDIRTIYNKMAVKLQSELANVGIDF